VKEGHSCVGRNPSIRASKQRRPLKEKNTFFDGRIKKYFFDGRIKRYFFDGGIKKYFFDGRIKRYFFDGGIKKLTNK